MHKFSRLSWVVMGAAIFFLFTLSKPALADTGPKPSMDFSLEYAIIPPPTLVSGFMMVCDDRACANPRNFTQHCSNAATPDSMMLTTSSDVYCYQRINCSNNHCIAYNTYDDYYRLDFTFSDGKTRVSNVFGKEYFYASYRVQVMESDLSVEELRGFAHPLKPLSVINSGVPLAALGIYLVVMVTLFMRLLGREDVSQSRGRYAAAWIVSVLFMLSCGLISDVFGGLTQLMGLWITLAVELTLGLFYAIWQKRPVPYLLTVILLMNMITQPVLQLVLTGSFLGNSLFWTLLAEIAVWLAEAWILARAMPGKVSFKETSLLSLVLNLASVGLGMGLPFA